MRKAKFFAAALLAMSSLGAFAQHQFTVQANKPGADIYRVEVYSPSWNI